MLVVEPVFARYFKARGSVNKEFGVGRLGATVNKLYRSGHGVYRTLEVADHQSSLFEELSQRPFEVRFIGIHSPAWGDPARRRLCELLRRCEKQKDAVALVEQNDARDAPMTGRHLLGYEVRSIAHEPRVVGGNWLDGSAGNFARKL